MPAEKKTMFLCTKRHTEKTLVVMTCRTSSEEGKTGINSTGEITLLDCQQTTDSYFRDCVNSNATSW